MRCGNSLNKTVLQYLKQKTKNVFKEIKNTQICQRISLEK